MKISKTRILAFCCAVLTLTAVELRASDPVGVYAVVEKVVFEPNENSPQRIQIRGAFALADGKPGDGYEGPQRGYLYYTIPPGKEEICKKEWADLKAVAGTGQGIGFGGRYAAKGRIRKTDERPEAPDDYPIGIGLVKMGSQHRQPSIITQLKETLRPR